MKILNKPKCHNYDRCGNEAITLVNGMWLCGHCLIRVNERVKKLKEQILLEE